MATPFKVSGLLPAWTELGLLQAQKQQLAGQLEAYDELQAKLDRVPDLSQAHVMVRSLYGGAGWGRAWGRRRRARGGDRS